MLTAEESFSENRFSSLPICDRRRKGKRRDRTQVEQKLVLTNDRSQCRTSFLLFSFLLSIFHSLILETLKKRANFFLSLASIFFIHSSIHSSNVLLPVFCILITNLYSISKDRSCFFPSLRLFSMKGMFYG